MTPSPGTQPPSGLQSAVEHEAPAQDLAHSLGPSERRQALDAIFQHSVPPMLTGLGAFFLFYAVFEGYTAPDALKAPLVAVDLTLVAALIGGRLVLARHDLPPRLAHPVGAGIMLALLAKNFHAMYLSSDLGSTAISAITLLATGVLFLSGAWCSLVLVAGLLGWLALARYGIEPPAPLTEGTVLLAAVAAGTIIHVVRVRVQLHLEVLRRENEQRARTVERINLKLREEIERRQRVEDALREARNTLAATIAARTADLRESEQRYRTLVENAPEAIVILDADSGRFIDANENALGLFGMSRDELCKHGPIELSAQVQPDGRLTADAAADYIDAAARGETPVFEWIHRNSTGEDLECEIRLVLLPSQTRRLVRGSVTDISERKDIERRLQEYSARLKTLSQQLIATQEAERAHIARELHDEIGQSLTALMINLQGRGAQGEARARDNLELVTRVLEQVRDLSLNLRPSMLDDLGLVTALRWLLKHQSERCHLTWVLATELPDERGISPALDTVCFRIVQEALTNIARHARATRVEVELKHDHGAFLLSVSDDGVGFDVAQVGHAAALGSSAGLLGMQERATLAGGKLEIRSAPGKGTVIRVRFPLHSMDEQAEEETDAAS